MSTALLEDRELGTEAKLLSSDVVVAPKVKPPFSGTFSVDSSSPCAQKGGPFLILLFMVGLGSSGEELKEKGP